LKTPQFNYPDGCLEVLGDGYYIDRMGWKRHIDPVTDMLTIKEQEWHDYDGVRVRLVNKQSKISKNEKEI
jgi:hypothetical protein